MPFIEAMGRDRVNMAVSEVTISVSSFFSFFKSRLKKLYSFLYICARKVSSAFTLDDWLNQSTFRSPCGIFRASPFLNIQSALWAPAKKVVLQRLPMFTPLAKWEQSNPQRFLLSYLSLHY